MGVRLFVGGHAGTVQGEREDLAGDRCFSAAVPQMPGCLKAGVEVEALGDSGAFTDVCDDKRLTPAGALERQFAWERRASEAAGRGWRFRHLVSYDLLIDEVWVAGVRHKRRWTVEAAEWAVRVTVEAARYLSEQRARVEPRTLVLACQGVDAAQYDECATEVLRYARPHDWIGLGGWCILGRFTSWMPVFWQTIERVLPRVTRAGVRHVHIFGVLYLPALGGLCWLADRYGLTVSTDSAAPILACTRGDGKKAGVREAYWRNNVRFWKDTLANIRESEYYRQPSTPAQRTLWEAA